MTRFQITLTLMRQERKGEISEMAGAEGGLPSEGKEETVAEDNDTSKIERSTERMLTKKMEPETSSWAGNWKVVFGL
jgi:hypothetical protein